MELESPECWKRLLRVSASELIHYELSHHVTATTFTDALVLNRDMQFMQAQTKSSADENEDIRG